MLVDSHCHLDYPDFADEMDEVMARAERAGVGLMLTIATTLAGFGAVRALAEKYHQVYCTVGVHPHEAEAEPETSIEQLLKLADHPKVVGIGETGLDYYYEHSPREVQQKLFRTHVAAARQSGLPLIVHSREAADDTAAILTDEMAEGSFKGLIHCFSSSAELAEKALELGFYISLSGILTFKAAGELRETVRGLPMERLLVETDAPYLAPVPKRGKRNEPAFVVHTAAQLAELKGLTAEETARRTTENFLALFDRVAAP